MEIQMDKFDNIHNNTLDGWGFSFRRSQLFRFDKYINILKRNNIIGKVLEIGCSTGFFTAEYLKRDYDDLTATDISSVAIHKAKEKYTDIDFKVSSLPKLEYKDDEFDLITVIELLYYLDKEDRIKSMDELYRLIKKGGSVLISVNIGNSPYFTISEIRELINRKFEIVEEDGLYIKSYYKIIETKLWAFLKLFSDYDKLNFKEKDSLVKKNIKRIINIFIKNKIVFYSYGFFIRNLIKGILFSIPINLINSISKNISKNEQSIYIALAKKTQ
jgi:ubiquinone/menaquinone biosynthesis C-methylase UbiE